MRGRRQECKVRNEQSAVHRQGRSSKNHREVLTGLQRRRTAVLFSTSYRPDQYSDAPTTIFPLLYMTLMFYMEELRMADSVVLTWDSRNLLD